MEYTIRIETENGDSEYTISELQEVFERILKGKNEKKFEALITIKGEKK